MMNTKENMFVRRAIAAVLAAVLALPVVNAMPLAAQQQDSVAQQQDSAAQQQATPQSAPTSPSGDQNAQPAAPGLETRPQTATPPDNPQPVQQNQNTRPVGTAAAPLTKPTGIAASRPAGAAIAPAKQRRVRTIMIRVGIIVGAAAAVGAVAGLSRSSSSRP